MLQFSKLFVKCKIFYKNIYFHWKKTFFTEKRVEISNEDSA